MGLFLNQGTFSNGGGASLSGLIDLEVALIDGQWRLYSASESSFGLGAFSINGSGALGALDFVNFGASSGTLGVTEIEIADVEGTDVLIPTGRYDNRIALHELDNLGNFDAVTGPSGGPASVSRVANLTLGNKTFAFVSELNGDGFSVYQISAAMQMSYMSSQVDTNATHIGDITSMVTARAYNKSFLFAASGFDAGVTSYTVNSQGQTVQRQNVGPESGLGIAAPSDMATVMVGNDLYMLLVSSQTDSLTAFKVSAYGRMRMMDHVFDDGDTYMQDVVAVEAVSANGRTFILVGGAEDGLSLFELTPMTGKLKFMDSIADTGALSLQDVTDIEAVVLNDVIHLYVSSNAEDGIAHFSLDLGVITAPVIGTKHADTLYGTAHNDLIMGMNRNDTLYGLDGDDRLVDGRGVDTLIGGAGADVFCFVADGMADILEDFTPGVDKIDMSENEMLYSLAQIELVEHNWGVLLIYGRDRIKLMDNAAVGEMNVSDLVESDFIFA